MLVGKQFKIESDQLNVTLSKNRKRTNKETGKQYEAWEVVGHFATVANAMHELVNQSIRDTELKDIKTIEAEIEALHNLINQHQTIYKA